MLYNFINYLLSYNLKFNRLYRRKAKFLPLKKSLSLKLFKLRLLKKTIWASEKNKMLMIKSVKLDLALTIGADFNLIILWEDNVNKLCSLKVMLVSFKIITNRNPI